jgi:hypothetical protein
MQTYTMNQYRRLELGLGLGLVVGLGLGLGLNATPNSNPNLNPNQELRNVVPGSWVPGAPVISVQPTPLVFALGKG